jgi:hypothetical protein
MREMRYPPHLKMSAPSGLLAWENRPAGAAFPFALGNYSARVNENEFVE